MDFAFYNDYEGNSVGVDHGNYHDNDYHGVVVHQTNGRYHRRYPPPHGHDYNRELTRNARNAMITIAVFAVIVKMMILLSKDTTTTRLPQMTNDEEVTPTHHDDVSDDCRRRRCRRMKALEAALRRVKEKKEDDDNNIESSGPRFNENKVDNIESSPSSSSSSLKPTSKRNTNKENENIGSGGGGPIGTNEKKTTTKKKKKKQVLSKKPKVEISNNHDPPSSSMASSSFNIMGALPIYDDGRTVVRHLAHLPDADKVASLLQRIVDEFLPIIRYRGYNVRSITEWCCCGDGLDYELGGHVKHIQKFQKLDGHEQSECGGYNRTMYQQDDRGRFFGRGRGRMGDSTTNNHKGTVHSIHLRMRDIDDHSMIYEYDTIMETMAHEIAHCEHSNHEEPFWDLMNDILQEHYILVQTKRLTGKLPLKYTTTNSEEDENDGNGSSSWDDPFDGFNIYGSSTSHLHGT